MNVYKSISIEYCLFPHHSWNLLQPAFPWPWAWEGAGIENGWIYIFATNRQLFSVAAVCHVGWWWWWWWWMWTASSSPSLQDSDFDSTGGLLGATIGRVKQLSRGSQTKLLCYMLLFCCFVFFVLYWFIRLRWSADRGRLTCHVHQPVAQRSWILIKQDWRKWRRGRRKSQMFLCDFFPPL